jgi:hypothetical protein
MTHPDDPLSLRANGRNRPWFDSTQRGGVAADHLLPLADEIERDLAVLITEARRRSLRPIRGGKP